MAKETVEYKKGDLVSSITEIQYTLIAKEHDFVQNNFFHATFSLLRELPKSLLQLKDPWNFFNICYKSVLRKGINLYSLPDFVFAGSAQDAAELFEDLSKCYNKDLVRVFIIDGDIEHHQAVGEFLKLIPFSYYHIIGPAAVDLQNNYDGTRRFEDSHHLISLLKNDLPALNDVLEKGDSTRIDDFNLLSTKHANELNPFYANPIGETNYFIFNQFLANFWLKKPRPHTADEIDFYRKKGMGIQLDQIQKIDSMHLGGQDQARISPIEPVYPTMVIIAPYHYPRMDTLYKELLPDETGKMLIRATHSEQKHNYDFIETEEMVNSLSAVAKTTLFEIEEKKLKSLDYLAYLHAQLNSSPFFACPQSAEQ